MDPHTPTPPTEPSELDRLVAERLERELQTCLEHAAEGLHWVGPDGTILWANQTELDLLGYTRDEYIGHNIREFHVEGDVIDDILTRLTRGETLHNYQASLRHRDGSIRHVEINSNVLWRGDEFLHTRCFTRDVTERKAADEAALRLAEIVEHSEDAIISQDLHGVITSWNPAAERMFGYAAEEATGQSIRIVLPPERYGEEEDVVARVQNGERVPPFDTVRRRKDGSPVDVALTVSPIRDRAGRVIGASKMARDISARKRIETRDRFLATLDDRIRPLTDAEEITLTAAEALGRHLRVNRCAYATVEADGETVALTGDYNDGVQSIIGRYGLRQFGEACVRALLAGEPYVVDDVLADERITDAVRPAYAMAAIRAVIAAPILKGGQLAAVLGVHAVGPRAWLPHEVELVQQVASRCWESIERARVSQTLIEREHQFRELANSIPNLTWMAHPDGSVYWYNDQWYAYTGTTPDDMLGWGWQRVHDPAMLPLVMEQWQRSIALGTPFEMVFPLRAADGSFRRFLTRVNPVRDSRGAVAHWFGTNTDVENERRATEANALLRQRERHAREEAELQKRRLYSLFMQAPMLIVVLRGPDHVIELANPPVREVWGKAEHELLNRPLRDVLPELRDQVFEALLDRVYRTGEPYAGTETPARLLRADGRVDTVYFNFVYSPFRNLHGDVEGVFVIASDVTEQVLARNQVNALREAAEAANRAKDEFLAMLGHELRNPLSPILTALQLMKLRGTDGSEREREVIERQVTHLTRLVDDLLDVSRIARGKVALKEDVFEVAEAVADAIETTSPLLEGRSHGLTVDVPRRGLPVKGDRVRLGQVVANLLTNAAKYTPPNGHITVRALEERGEVVIGVRDTGMGIAPDILPRIFDLFVQERQAIDRSQGGLGLGLTIVRNLVERHGGTVAAHSEGPGRGSEFLVRLPKADVAAAESPAVVPGHLAAVEAAVGGRRVLVVDDNEDSAEMLATALAAKGYETRTAHDALAALRVAEEFVPDIALLDIGLPVMDGYELAVRLRQLPQLGGVRLVAVTGYGQESDRRKARAAGFHEHLVKPVDFALLEAVVGA